MAVFIPEVKPEEFNNSYGEKRVYEALRALNDRYTIFYSFSWVGLNGERTVGEADFVIVHPEKGLAVIEVKSGGIEYRDGEWIQTNTKTRQSKRISPFVQARKSQFEILERMVRQVPRPRPMMCYCVWFTSVAIPSAVELPAESPRQIVLDKNSLADPEAAIEAMFDYWATKYPKVSLDDEQYQRVIDALCPHFHVIPKLKAKMQEAEHAYIQLTRQQVSLLDFLEEQDTAAIHGLAGTGKTVLAVEKAKRLASQGESVLFLCYNSFLKDALKESNPIPGVAFHNAHSLAYEVMGSRDCDIDEVLSRFEDYLEEDYDPETWKYRNVIIDEGQDLDDRLLIKLSEFVRKQDGSFYAFYDRNQYIMKNRRPEWIDSIDCRLVLHRNCRNTAEVFNVSCNLAGMKSQSHNDIHGEVPAVRFCHTERDMEEVVADFMNFAESEGLDAEDIVVLTAKTTAASWIEPGRRYGCFELSETREKGKVLFTTIRKFKGLEAEAVLIVDASMLSLLKAEERRLLYVGTSRARNFLNIAMIEDVEDDGMGDYLRKLAPDRSMPKNKKGFKRLLGLC